LKEYLNLKRKCLISLIKKYFNKNSVVYLRNLINFKPVYFKKLPKNKIISISDAFVWRTDQNFKTKFKFADIYYLFFGIEDSWVEILFFSKEKNFLKKIKIGKLEVSNELVIDSNFLNNINDFGTFYIYHYTNKLSKLNDGDAIQNRCYVGYSKEDNIYSYMHGNTFSSYADITLKTRNYNSNLINFSFFTNNFYSIQKNFNDYDSNELFFSNPTTKKMILKIDGEKHVIMPGFLKKINSSKKDVISFKSNSLFLRPVVFSYKNNYYDVHHS
jgi:hypothetical protein